MLKLYLYGYLNRMRSSRRLEAEAARNLELIWLLRGLRPDYKTIADFRRDNRLQSKKSHYPHRRAGVDQGRTGLINLAKSAAQRSMASP